MVTSGQPQSEVEAVEGVLFLPTADRLIEARRLRDELREDLDAAQDSVRWLRSELRSLERLPPRPRVQSVVYVACGLGAIVGAGIAMWAR
ncbi:MAG: hypothetical protein Q8L48_13540 [Archangium sp.]|nr:hypothetical protein [Archangium sp.]